MHFKLERCVLDLSSVVYIYSEKEVSFRWTRLEMNKIIRIMISTRNIIVYRLISCFVM